LWSNPGPNFRERLLFPTIFVIGKKYWSSSKECQMIGQIYSNGYSSFDGVLFGSFYTTGFIKSSSSGLYENYLVDVCIDSKRLPAEYCGISLINKSNEKACVEEVY